jgi:hypothetical protein
VRGIVAAGSAALRTGLSVGLIGVGRLARVVALVHLGLPPGSNGLTIVYANIISPI